MSHRLTTWQKATALVPLALLSSAWTTSLAGFGTVSASTGDGARLPDGTELPAEAVEAPASLSAPGEIAPGVPTGAADTVVRTASANGIPSAALAAYQRAAQVIDNADPSCHLGWQLIAAIGRVESDHGRYGGNTLSADGRSTPGIYGIPLDGSHGTQRISDTDGGRFDDDKVLDRAVGPMQFIPATWSVVGVDGDGDGVRDPQDIDDAALATAVYLCSGDEDLATTAGQRAAVYRYNHSQEYVDLVLAIMQAYTDGDYSAVPTGAAAPTSFFPSPDMTDLQPVIRKEKKDRPGAKAGGSATKGSAGSGSSGGDGTGSTGSSADPTDPVTDPAPSGGGAGAVTGPVEETVKKVTKPIKPVTDPVVDTISAGAEAVDFCSGQLSGLLGSLPPLLRPDTVVSTCAGKIAGMTEQQAKDAIPNTLSGLLTWLGLG